MSSRLPSVVRTLIRRHVRSVGELELLVLLRAEPVRSWSVDEVCDALGCPRAWALAQLEDLRSAGLVIDAHDDRWRFAPASAELDRATGALAETYRRQPRDVVRFVFATPGRHPRRRPSAR